MLSRVALILWFASGFSFAQSPARTCIGTAAVGTFRILVSSPNGSNPLPVRSLNNIAANSKISYEPIQLPDNLKKNGKLAVVAVPADPDQRAAQGAMVLEPKPAGATAEWIAPFRIGTMLIAFAPQGLDEKRVVNLVSRDEDLIDDLARYAERTVELENTIEALTILDAEEDEAADPSQAAGGSNSPVEQALFTLTRALNPTSTYFNPLTSGATIGPQTRSGVAANMFFANAGGIIPGGGALSMAKTWLMPDSEFRTVYAESAPGDGLTLCAQKMLTRTRNRMVYLWGYQLINSPAPKFSQGFANSIPAGARSTISVKTPSRQDWALLNRVREWALVNTSTNRETPVKVRTASARGWAEIDLRRTAVEPGTYKLKGRWDWDTVNVEGTWKVASTGDLSRARVAPESAARLVENSGMAPVELEGTDFQFVDRVALKRAGKLGAINTPLEFRLPEGFRAGPQNKLEIEINTDTFHAGSYLLAVQQVNGKSQDIPLQISPVPPRISNLPIRVNLGETQPQRVTLRGTGLDRLGATIETPEGLRIQMLDGSDTERDAVVTMAAALKPGSRIRSAGGLAFQIAGAKPKITAATPAMPDDLPAALRDGELPAGLYVSFTIKADNVEAPASIALSCAESALGFGGLKVRLGERTQAVKFVASGSGVYYASFDPGSVGQSGCTLNAVIETEAAGASTSVALGKVVRLPRLDALTWTDEKAQGGYVAILRGTDLERIEKAGWDGQGTGVAVTDAPKAADRDTQTLRVVLPWPPPSPLAPLQIWLRGDSQGRKAVIRR
jgi:hypothetical protein